MVIQMAAVTEPGQLVVNTGGADEGTDWDYNGTEDLVRWVRVRGAVDGLVLPGDWAPSPRPGVVPPYPVASNLFGLP